MNTIRRSLLCLTGGLLIASLHSIGVAFLIFALPTLVAGAAMLAGGRLYGSQGARRSTPIQPAAKTNGASA